MLSSKRTLLAGGVLHRGDKIGTESVVVSSISSFIGVIVKSTSACGFANCSLVVNCDADVSIAGKDECCWPPEIPGMSPISWSSMAHFKMSHLSINSSGFCGVVWTFEELGFTSIVSKDLMGVSETLGGGEVIQIPSSSGSSRPSTICKGAVL